MQEFLPVLERHGFAIFVSVVLLFAFGTSGTAIAWAIWRVVRWTGNEIIKPLRDKGAAFLDSTVDNQKASAIARVEHTHILRILSETTQASQKNTEAIQRHVESIEKKQEEHLRICRGDDRQDDGGS